MTPPVIFVCWFLHPLWTPKVTSNYQTKVFQMSSPFALHFGPLTSDPPTLCRTRPQHSAGAVSRNSSWSYNGLCESIVSLFLALPKACRGLNNPVSVHRAPALCRGGVGEQSGSEHMMMKVFLQLLAWRQVSRLHQCHYSPLFINPSQTRGTWPRNNQASYLFLKKKIPSPLCAASAHWRQWTIVFFFFCTFLGHGGWWVFFGTEGIARSGHQIVERKERRYYRLDFKTKMKVLTFTPRFDSFWPSGCYDYCLCHWHQWLVFMDGSFCIWTPPSLHSPFVQPHPSMQHVWTIVSGISFFVPVLVYAWVCVGAVCWGCSVCVCVRACVWKRESTLIVYVIRPYPITQPVCLYCLSLGAQVGLSCCL